MTNGTPAPRRYTDEEVGRILRRATELQRADPVGADAAGLTLTELEEIAAEAGIDPAVLRRAASELQARRTETLGSVLTGAPSGIEIERVVDGEIPPGRLQELVPVIQSSTAGLGTASAVGGTLTWSSRSESNTSAQQVLVSSLDGRTLIRVQETYGGLAAGLFGGIIGGVGGGIGFGLGGALSATLGLGAGLIALPLTTVAGSYFLARAIYSAQVRRREAAAQVLVDRLAETVQMYSASTGGLAGGLASSLPPAAAE